MVNRGFGDMAGTKFKVPKAEKSKKVEGKARSVKRSSIDNAAKIEKKRAKLLTRSQELEKEAHKLLAEAKKAVDKYEELTRELEAGEDDDDTSSEVF